jgi:putative component of membrane protein insertase Oxa1/YidC/SpoIIIJ protein YidD
MALIFISSIAFSQKKTDLNIFKKITSKFNEKSHYQSHFSTDELKNTIALFFIGYKTFVSSQDANRCAFYPSCSVYSVETIRKNGVITGFLDTFDRLQRCNPYSPEKYHIHKPTGKFYDPVQ